LKRVKPYIIYCNEVLGQGTFGKVCLGKHEERMGEDLAIKIIPVKFSQGSSQGSTEESLALELKIFMKAQHANLVKLIDAKRTKNNFYLVTELCRGGTLKDFLWKTPGHCLDETLAISVFSQIVNGY